MILRDKNTPEYIFKILPIIHEQLGGTERVDIFTNDELQILKIRLVTNTLRIIAVKYTYKFLEELAIQENLINYALKNNNFCLVL